MITSSVKSFLRRFLKALARSRILTSICARIVTYAFDDPQAGKELQAWFLKSGFYFLRKHYYLPIPDETELTPQFFTAESAMTGVDLNASGALDLLHEVLARHTESFRNRYPLTDETGRSEFHLLNGSFMAVDAHVYYAMINHFRPKRIVEIGCGCSTALAASAALKIKEFTRHEPEVVAIEPYPNEALGRGFPGLNRLIQAKVQDVPLDLFTSLQEGDILFIDSTHSLKAGGDVQYEYLEILPRLQKGVLVHVHDISLPKNYPRVYFENGLYWNEQYLLQAFLAFNRHFRVLWAGNYMLLTHPKEVLGVFPEIEEMRKIYPASEPSSFWMQVLP